MLKHWIGCRRLSLLLAALSIWAVCRASGAEFQTLPPWRVATWFANRGTAEAAAGVLTVRQTAPEQQTVVYREYKLEGGKKYVLSVAMRGSLNAVSNPKTRSGAWLEVTTAGGKKYLAGGSPAGSFRASAGEFDWKTYRAEFTMPADQTAIKVLIQVHNATGEVQFKDLELQAFSSGATPAPASTPAPSIAGAEFQTLPPWRVATWLANRGTAEAAAGVLTVRQTAPEQQTVVYREYKLEGGKKYVLSVAMRGSLNAVSNPQTRNGAWLEVTTAGGKKYLAGGSPAGSFRASAGEFDWKTYRAEFTMPADQTAIKVLIQVHNATGEVQFKDFELREASVAAASAVQQPRPAALRLVSSVWDNHVVYLAAGLPMPFLVDWRMNPALSAGARVELELPDGITALCGAPWRPRLNGSGEIDLTADPVEKLPAARTGFSIYRFAPNPEYLRSLLPDRMGWQNYYRIYVRSERTGMDLPARVRVLDAADQVLAELPLTLQAMPKLPAVPYKLKNFKFHMTYLDALRAPQPEIRAAYTDFWLALAERPSTSPVFRFDKLPAAIRKEVLDKFNPVVFFGCTPSGVLNAEIPAGMPLLEDYAGQRDPKAVCPRESGNPDSPVWTEATVRLIKTSLSGLPENTPLQYDFEPGLPMNRCFCEACRRDFSESVKAPRILSAAEIRASYAAPWVRFRVAQNARIAEAFALTVKKYFPTHPVWFCTDPLHVDRPSGFSDWCGLDPRLNDRGNYDLFLNMFYHEGVPFFDNVALNVAKIRTPTFPLIDPTERMEMYYRRYTPAGVTMDMVAAAALGCPGFGFWPFDDFDARYLKAIVDGVNMIAPHENFYCGGRDASAGAQVRPLNVAEMKIQDGARSKTIQTPDFLPTLRWRLHRSGDEYLLTVFNYDPDNTLIAAAEIAELKGRGYQVYEASTRRKLGGFSGEDFQFEVGPRQAAQFRLTPGAWAAAQGEIPRHELERKLAAARERGNEFSDHPNRTEGKLFAGWGVLNDLNKPLLKLSDNQRAIYVDLSGGGRIVGCLTDSLSDALKDAGKRGHFDELYIYRNALPLEFHLQALKFVDGAPEAWLTAQVPLPNTAEPDPQAPSGLRISKQVRLTKTGVVSKYELENPAESGRDILAGARIRHWPRFAPVAEDASARAADWQLTVPAANGASLGAADFAGSDILLLTESSSRTPGELLLTPFKERWSGAPVEVRSAAGHWTFGLDPAAARGGILFWWSPNQPATVEPLTVERRLKPGEKMNFTSFLSWD